MALVTANCSFILGFDQRPYESRSALTISGTTTGLAMPFIAEFTGTITRVVIPIASVTTAVTNLDIGIQAFGGGGLPSGTFLATQNTVSFSTQAFPSNYVLTLTNPVSVTMGQFYYIVVIPNGSFTGNISFHYLITTAQNYSGMLRPSTRVASAWVRAVSGSSSQPIYGSATNWYSLDQPAMGAQSNYQFTVTFTNGSANVTSTYNTATLNIDSPVRLTTTGTLPTNFAINTTYYIKTTSATNVTLSATRGGAAISAGSAGTGTHTMTACINESDEIGFAFTLDANHPAIKLDALSMSLSLTLTNPGMTFSLKQYNASGTLLNTIEALDTDRFNGSGVGFSYFKNATSSDIWLEPNTKYYFLLAFTGTFTAVPTDWRVFDYDSQFTRTSGAFTTNYAYKYGATIVENTNMYTTFGLQISGIRYNDSGGGGGYIDGSSFFNGGFSG